MALERVSAAIETGEGVEAVHRIDGNIVAALQGNMLVTSFHPELTDDTTFHRYFINMIEENRK